MLHFAYLLRPGAHEQAAWRFPGNRVEDATTLGYHVELTQRAEAAGIAAILYADAVSVYGEPNERIAQPLEPVTLLSALAGRTSRIGLIATISTTYSEPYNIARQLASLDHISRGRAGWNIVTSGGSDAARNFGTAEHPTHAERYARADEFVQVTKLLWESWDAGAILVDRENDRAIDPAKVHAIDFTGKHFSVRGPLNVPRSPQVWPLLAHAGQSPDGLAVAAKHAEFLYAVQYDIDVARQARRHLRDLVTAAGRSPDSVKVFPGLVPIVGSTEREAQDLAAQLRELTGPESYADSLSNFFKMDLNGLDPDTLLTADRLYPPDAVQQSQSFYRLIFNKLAERPLTIRELIRTYQGIGRAGHFLLVGTAEQVADTIGEWYLSGAADGFVLMPATVPGGADDFYDNVLPILRRRGLFDPDPGGETLRDRLGLSAGLGARTG